MATNELYTLIQNKMSEIDNISKGITTKQQNGPTVEANLREATMGNDAGLNDLRNSYSAGVLELFKHDQSKAANYLSPEAQAGGMVANPMAAETESNNKFNSIATATQTTWKELDKRKTVLGDTLATAMKFYQAGIEGDKTSLEAAKYQLDAAQNLMAEERLSDADASGKTARERLRNANLDQLNTDIANGATVQDVMDRYAKDLDQSDIMDEYNKNNKYGKVTESNTTLNTMYRAAKAGSNTLDLIGQISNKQVAGEVASNALMAADSKAFLQQLGTENPDYVKAIISGNFPLAQKYAAKFGKDSSFYSQLNAYAANVIKAYYGSAFTSTEVTAARQWVANPTVQNGNQLYSSLVANNLTASRRIKTSLATVGLTDENYVNQYISQVGGNYDPKTGLNINATSNSNSGKVHVSGPNGENGFIDTSELNEAVKNGWKKL